jgi:EAL domain-containing protein (putative c-di-GMP-specific phosphodiesterase class I)
MEALVRWNHPEQGWISPARFIPIAEESHLICRIGEWVLRKACEDAASWPGDARVAVNVSHPVRGFVATRAGGECAGVVGAGARPAELEITEGVFLQEGGTTDAMFRALKDLGVRLALDDFGTGYSSLAYLKTAPFDKIKIDQSVRGATGSGSRNRAIIAAIVALAKALDMETTAEGVESFDQFDLMKSLEVSHVQGFIYSPRSPTTISWPGWMAMDGSSPRPDPRGNGMTGRRCSAGSARSTKITTIRSCCATCRYPAR